MPSSPNYKRDLKQEYKTAKARGEKASGHNGADAVRHRARRLMEKHLGRKLSPNETVEHKTKLKDGGGNAMSNLTLMSKHKQSVQGGKAGSKAGKSKGGKKGGSSNRGVLSAHN